jgi:hypothetical protein
LIQGVPGILPPGGLLKKATLSPTPNRPKSCL